MTAFAFILGVVPLMIATGSGAGGRVALGTAVFYGMLLATIVGVLNTPGLFVFIEKLGRRKEPKGADGSPGEKQDEEGGEHAH